MKTPAALVGLLGLVAFAHAQTTADLVCSYAPSQSSVVAAMSGAAGGSAAVLATVAQATGLSVVAHSSGAAILTGSGGYIAGTIGSAAAAPFIVTVGVVAGGTAVVVELVCARQNHPDQVAKIEAAAMEYRKRSMQALGKAKAKAGVALSAGKAQVAVIKESVLDYAYKRIPKDKTVVLAD